METPNVDVPVELVVVSTEPLQIKLPQHLVYEAVINRCRFCLVEHSRKPLMEACACTKLRFTHADCLGVFVNDNEQFNCELCHQPFRMSPDAHQQVARTSANRYMPATVEMAHPSQEDIYFVWSSLFDRIIVFILLYIYLVYLSPSADGHLPNYLMGHALFYLVHKLCFGGLRVRELYCHLRAPRR